MKKNVTAALSFLVLAATLVLPWQRASATVLKIATVSPEGATWMVKMREGASQIQQRTNGRVKFKFYSGGVMGSDASVLRKIKIGQLHGGAVTGGSLLSIYPDLSLYSLPFVFRSLDEVDAVREKMDTLLIEGLEEKGFVTFGLAEGGFAYLMSNHKVQSTDDLKQQKVWVDSGDKVTQTVFETASVDPVPLPVSDVMTGLQTGLIDTVATSPIAAIALQWHTRVKFMTDTPLSYFFAMLTVSKKAFNKIAAEDQAVIRDVMATTFAQINERNRIDNQGARQALQNQGIKFVDITSDILDGWKQTAHQATRRLAQEQLVTPAMYNKMQDILNAYRNSQASVAVKNK